MSNTAPASRPSSPVAAGDAPIVQPAPSPAPMDQDPPMEDQSPSTEDKGKGKAIEPPVDANDGESVIF